ncbi:MAG: MerR family transcriptional regulator [Lachnospiraceae bacterium]|nr:MerR family transcriptional regulator [Lachnospiraceae bacterium]
MSKIYQVSEAAEELGMEVYTLRYWENQLGIEVPRNTAGHRYYEEQQLELFRGVKRLKDAGFGLRQIKAMAERMPAVAALPDEKLEDLRKRIAGIEAEQEEAVMIHKNEHFKEREKFSLCVGGASACVTPEVEEHTDGVRMLQEGMTKWLGEMLKRNNEQLTQKIEEGVSERMARELKFLFRQQEEREEERYRRLDRTIREYQQARANARQQQNGRDNFLLTRKVRPLH